MSKQAKKVTHNFSKQKDFGDFATYIHKQNGFTLLHYPIPETGVITTNITYKVGSVDEKRGESGLAHMLEHMLFKPTKQDLAKGIQAGSAMQFERDTGAQLNANTYYDRTTYFFNFPKKHLSTVLQLESNRMQDVVLSDKEFQPERGNVLSEFDMYNGDPYFALEVAMRTAVFQSHAYDHEIIGFREDIEDYTIEKLQKFYDMYYQPNNATLMLIGDISKDEALQQAEKYFAKKKNKVTHIHRETAREPKIVGPKTVTITRPGTTNILTFGFIHPAFPSHDWQTANLAMHVLASGPESILHKHFVDTGLVSSVDDIITNSPQPNMGLLFFRLAKDVTHEEIEQKFHKLLLGIDSKEVASLLKKQKAQLITSELFKRSSSLGLAAQLTEHVATDSLQAFSEIETLIQKVTTKDVMQAISTLFDQNTLTTGYYKSV